MTDQAIDATAVEDGMELEPVDRTSLNLFHTDDPVEVVEKATQVANALKDVIQQRGLFTVIGDKAHVRVEGWTLLGSMLGVTAVVTDTEPVAGGWKARVEARAADGRVVGAAEALCTRHEKRGPWKSADDYARLSMAQTRATSKALRVPLGFVVSLAGYETTPAEELPPQEEGPPDMPPNRTEATRQAGPPRREFERTGRSDIPEAPISREQYDALKEEFARTGNDGDSLQRELDRLGAADGDTPAARIASLTELQAQQLSEYFAALDTVPVA